MPICSDVMEPVRSAVTELISGVCMCFMVTVEGEKLYAAAFATSQAVRAELTDAAVVSQDEVTHAAATIVRSGCEASGAATSAVPAKDLDGTAAQPPSPQAAAAAAVQLSKGCQYWLRAAFQHNRSEIDSSQLSVLPITPAEQMLEKEFDPNSALMAMWALNTWKNKQSVSHARAGAMWICTQSTQCVCVFMCVTPVEQDVLDPMMEPLKRRLKKNLVSMRNSVHSPNSTVSVGDWSFIRADVIFHSDEKAPSAPSNLIQTCVENCVQFRHQALKEMETMKEEKSNKSANSRNDFARFNCIHKFTVNLCHLFFLTATRNQWISDELRKVLEAMQYFFVSASQCLYAAQQRCKKEDTAHMGRNSRGAASAAAAAADARKPAVDAAFRVSYEHAVSQVAVLAYHVLLVQTEYGGTIHSTTCLDLPSMVEACVLLRNHVAESLQPERFLEGLAVLEACTRDGSSGRLLADWAPHKQDARLFPLCLGSAVECASECMSADDPHSERRRLWGDSADVCGHLEVHLKHLRASKSLSDMLHFDTVLMMYAAILRMPLPSTPVSKSATPAPSTVSKSSSSPRVASKAGASAAKATGTHAAATVSHNKLDTPRTASASDKSGALRKTATLTSKADQQKKKGSHSSAESSEGEPKSNVRRKAASNTTANKKSARTKKSATSEVSESDSGSSSDGSDSGSSSSSKGSASSSSSKGSAPGDNEEDEYDGANQAVAEQKPSPTTLSTNVPPPVDVKQEDHTGDVVFVLNLKNPPTELLHFHDKLQSIVYRELNKRAVVVPFHHTQQAPPIFDPALFDSRLDASWLLPTFAKMTLGCVNDNGVKEKKHSCKTVDVNKLGSDAEQSSQLGSADAALYSPNRKIEVNAVQAFLIAQWEEVQQHAEACKSGGTWPGFHSVPSTMENRVYLKDGGREARKVKEHRRATSLFPMEDRLFDSVTDPANALTIQANNLVAGAEKALQALNAVCPMEASGTVEARAALESMLKKAQQDLLAGQQQLPVSPASSVQGEQSGQQEFFAHRTLIRALDERVKMDTRLLSNGSVAGKAFINPLYLDEARLHRLSLPRLSAVEFFGVDTCYIYLKDGFQFFNLHIEQMLFSFVHHQVSGSSQWYIIPFSELSKVYELAADMYDAFYPGADPALEPKQRTLLGRALLYSKQLFPPEQLLRQHKIVFEIKRLHTRDTLVAHGGFAHFGFSTSGGQTVSMASNSATDRWLEDGIPWLKDHYEFLDKLYDLVQKRSIDTLGSPLKDKSITLLPLEEVVRKTHFVTPDNFACSFLRGLYADLGVAFGLPDSQFEAKPNEALCSYPNTSRERAIAVRLACQRLVKRIHEQRPWKQATDTNSCVPSCDSSAPKEPNSTKPLKAHKCMLCRCCFNGAGDELWEDTPIHSALELQGPGHSTGELSLQAQLTTKPDSVPMDIATEEASVASNAAKRPASPAIVTSEPFGPAAKRQKSGGQSPSPADAASSAAAAQDPEPAEGTFQPAMDQVFTGVDIIPSPPTSLATTISASSSHSQSSTASLSPTSSASGSPEQHAHGNSGAQGARRSSRKKS
jgi:hypothetical protein